MVLVTDDPLLLPLPVPREGVPGGESEGSEGGFRVLVTPSLVSSS